MVVNRSNCPGEKHKHHHKGVCDHLPVCKYLAHGRHCKYIGSWQAL